MNNDRKVILYVDDDPDDLALFRQAVQSLDTDYQILEAFDGVNALELLTKLDYSNELPCLIVLDINMPRMDGKETVVALQKDTKFYSIPIVLYSTSSSQLDRTFSRSKEVELITKPFDYDTILNVTRKLLNYCEV